MFNAKKQTSSLDAVRSAAGANSGAGGGFVIGMASPGSGFNAQPIGSVFDGDEIQLTNPKENAKPMSRVRGDVPTVPSVGFRLSPNGLTSVFADARDADVEGQYELTAELDLEMTKMGELIRHGDPEKQIMDMPGGAEIHRFIEENLQDVTREVTFMSTMPNGGFDDNWKSRILVYMKSKHGAIASSGGDAPQKEWRFGHAMLVEPKLQVEAKDELEVGMNLSLVKQVNGKEVYEGAVAIWITPIESNDCFFFWMRHELGASVCGIMKGTDSDGHFLMNGERGCQLMAMQVALKKQSKNTANWGGMCERYLQMVSRLQAGEVKEALKRLGFDKDIGPEELLSVLQAFVPTKELARFLSSSTSVLGNGLLNDMEAQNRVYIESIDELVDAFHDNLESEKKAHDAARDREKKRFLKDLASRDKFNKGVTDRASRLEAEVRSLRAQLSQVKSNTQAGKEADQSAAAGPSRLACALSEVFG